MYKADLFNDYMGDVDSDKDSASDEDDGSRGDGGVEGLGVLLGQKINLFMMLKMMETCRP